MVAKLWLLASCFPAFLWPLFILYVGGHSVIRGELLTATAAYISGVIVGALVIMNVPDLCDPTGLTFGKIFISLAGYTLVIPAVGLLFEDFYPKPNPLTLQGWAWLIVLLEVLYAGWKVGSS